MPPVAVTVTVELPLWQRIGVALDTAASTGGCVIVTAAVAVQLFASVTMNVYVPGPRVNVPVPEYAGVPPEAVTVTVEVPPLHAIGVAETVTVSAGGSVIVTVADALQLFASVTVKV